MTAHAIERVAAAAMADETVGQASRLSPVDADVQAGRLPYEAAIGSQQGTGRRGLRIYTAARPQSALSTLQSKAKTGLTRNASGKTPISQASRTGGRTVSRCAGGDLRRVAASRRGADRLLKKNLEHFSIAVTKSMHLGTCNSPDRAQVVKSRRQKRCDFAYNQLLCSCFVRAQEPGTQTCTSRP